jgi:hypothetical protein
MVFSDPKSVFRALPDHLWRGRSLPSVRLYCVWSLVQERGLVSVKMSLLGEGAYSTHHKCWSICPVGFGVQDDCRREWLRTKDTGTKWRQGCQAFPLLLVTYWTFAGPSEEPVLLATAANPLLQCHSASGDGRVEIRKWKGRPVSACLLLLSAS